MTSGFAPAFTVNTTAINGAYDIEYIDFDDSDVNNSVQSPYPFAGAIVSNSSATQMAAPR